jgi:hypothetical protein
LRGDGFHFAPEIRRIFGDRHLSTSPMTVSSEPTIAIRSAMYDPWTVVAVASSAAKEGARNLTRHGRGPPSETT